MKNKSIFSIIFLFLLIVPSVSANSIVIHDEYIEIYEWIETNAIEGNNLDASVVLWAKLLKEVNSGYSKITFYPGEFLDTYSLMPKDVSFTICKGEARGNIFDKIEINCIEKIEFFNKTSENPPKYILNIRNSNLNKGDIFLIGAKYVIPSFVGKNTEKLVLLKTDCSGDGVCPQHTNIIKNIKLPKNAAVRQYPSDAVLSNINERLVMVLSDFKKPELKNFPNRYNTKTILYTDLIEVSKEQASWFMKGVGITLLISGILTIISWGLTYHYYKKSESDAKTNFSRLEKTFNKILDLQKKKNRKTINKKP